MLRLDVFFWNSKARLAQRPGHCVVHAVQSARGFPTPFRRKRAQNCSWKRVARRAPSPTRRPRARHIVHRRTALLAIWVRRRLPRCRSAVKRASMLSTWSWAASCGWRPHRAPCSDRLSTLFLSGIRERKNAPGTAPRAAAGAAARRPRRARRRPPPRGRAAPPAAPPPLPPLLLGPLRGAPPSAAAAGLPRAAALRPCAPGAAAPFCCRSPGLHGRNIWFRVQGVQRLHNRDERQR